MSEELRRYKITIDIELDSKTLSPKLWNWDDLLLPDEYTMPDEKINGVWVEEVDLEAPLG